MTTVATRVFRSGNSEAVRLPKAIAYGRDIALVAERTGDVVTLRPAVDAVLEKQKVLDLVAALQAIGPPPDGVQAREPIEWPDREGLYD